MTGFFKIRCALDKEGTQWNETVGINQTSAGSGTIRDSIIRACPIYRDNIEVIGGSQFVYNDDGRDFLVRFIGLNYDVPLMQISSTTDQPIVGGNNITF